MTGPGVRTYRIGRDGEALRYRKLKGRQLEDYRNSAEVKTRLLTPEERKELGLL